MRIATANAYDATVDSLTRRKSDLSATQAQISTNRRVNKASDDPVAASRSARDSAALQSNKASTRALDISQNAMTLTDSALNDASDLLLSARDALVAAGNGGYAASDRAALVDQLKSVRGQLLHVANTTNGSGQYLFGGRGSAKLPFIDSPGGVQYNGASGQQLVPSGEVLPTSLDGAVTWMQAATGNGSFTTSAVTSTGTGWIDRGTVTDPSALTGSDYSVQFSVSGGSTTYSILKDGVATAQAGVAFKPGSAIAIDGMSFNVSGSPADGDEFAVGKSTQSLSVFDALDKAIAGLQNPSANSGQVQQTVNAGIGDLDQSLARLSSMDSAVGATLNRIDNVTNRLADAKLSSQTDQANAVDLDMAEAISNFSAQQTNYQVALQAYAQVQKLSLFNYIS